ncbi:MAG: restriction endonuclease subunit S [Nitrospinae bacterium]|nr:restriction endonuclease subunit S [Nitrospinota bacterium]
MNLKPYPKYKDSGIEWLGEIPEGWEIEKLRFIGRFTASGIDKKIVEGEPLVKIINYTDIYGNTIQTLKSDNNYMEVSCPEEKRRQHQVRKGDLIFTPSSETIEDIGLSAVVDEELENTAYSYHVLRFRFEKEVDHNFKKYLCNNDFVLNQFSSNAKGTTRQILNRENFNSTVVILPPVDEQTAIATLLDQKTAKIDELIRKNETLVELLKEKRQAIISHAVTKGIPHHPPLEKGGWGDLKMKDSGIEWLGEIQQGWEVKRLKYVANVNPQALTENTNIGYELKYVDISNVGEEVLLN